MEIEQTNQEQENSLAKLRASIQAQREHQAEQMKLEFPPQKREFLPVPEITLPDKTEFSLERYQELCAKVDILYHNFLTAQEQNENVLEVMRELARCFDSFITEGLKIRWS